MSDEAQQLETGPQGEDARTDDTIRRVLEALRGLKYGQISIIVQDGVVIQIERTERFRLRRSTK
jgi:hypothetical protein